MHRSAGPPRQTEQTDIQTDRQTDRKNISKKWRAFPLPVGTKQGRAKIDRSTDTQTDKQQDPLWTDRQTVRQADRQTDRKNTRENWRALPPARWDQAGQSQYIQIDRQTDRHPPAERSRSGEPITWLYTLLCRKSCRNFSRNSAVHWSLANQSGAVHRSAGPQRHGGGSGRRPYIYINYIIYIIYKLYI